MLPLLVPLPPPESTEEYVYNSHSKTPPTEENEYLELIEIVKNIQKNCNHMENRMDKGEMQIRKCDIN